MENSNALYDIGFRYENGIGVEKDQHNAFINYQTAAEMGNAVAINRIGYCYQHGIGVEKDDYKAFFYYQKAAEMGNTTAICNIGYCYHNGIGVEKDEHRAFFYYQKAAEMGNAGAIYSIGYCYRNGIGVEKDYHKAFFYYQKAAEMGIDRGAYNIADSYRYGIGVEKDEKKAFEFYKKSAEMGFVSGKFEVARCYRNGFGVDRDLHNANNWYRRAEKEIANKYECASKEPGIDDGLKKMSTENGYKLQWIPYDEFKNIQAIGNGGFATVYRTDWSDKSQELDTSVALKVLNIADFSEFIKELKVFCEIRDIYPSFLKCYGITKNKDEKYILVLEYANKESLKKNLIDVARMDWKRKIKLLQCMTSDLDMIHFQGYVHRDLHSGNILQHDIDNAYIADLGLSLSMNSKTGKIYGVLPYVDPEVLLGHKFTEKSDIYSLGIIMFEISNGNRPYDGHQFDLSLAIKICDGLRPNFFIETPECFVELAKQCMNSDPQKRPTASNIQDKLNEWNRKIDDPTENEIKKQFLEANEMINELPIFSQNHPDHMYTSKIINTGEIKKTFELLKNSRNITEKLSEKALVSKGIEFSVPDDS